MVIAFQGAYGAYSDMACRQVFPDMESLPCRTFEDAFQAVLNGQATLAMIPVDNTLAGRVADVHHLLEKGQLFITGEFFLPVRHCLLAPKGSKLETIKHVYSHIHALPQCRTLIRDRQLTPHVFSDTAGAAQEVARLNDKSCAAIASPLAAQIYDLDIVAEDIQDADHNTTRFLILAAQHLLPERGDHPVLMTSFLFQVRNIPAALYKALGGFSTNGVNMTKIESYVDEHFQAARFLCDVEGHPEDEALKNALEELRFFAREVIMLGTYPAHPFRQKTRP